MKSLFYHRNVHLRFIFLVAFFLLLFHSAAIFSFLLLPEGLLLSKNSILDWEAPDDVLQSAVMLLLYNSLSMIIIAIANFLPFPNKENPVMPLGYWCLFIQILLNGITLGTWSFTAVLTAVPGLGQRLLRTFDVFHRSGLWEMTGQIMIAAATARIAIPGADRDDNYIRPIKEVRLSRTEILYIVLGVCMLLTGAFIESAAIIKL